MSFTRFNYDEVRTKKILQESTDPGRWILNTPGCGTPSFVDDPRIRMQYWGNNLRLPKSGNPVDIASELDGRTRKKTKACSKHMYPNTDILETKPYANKERIHNFTQDSRFSHPAWMYRHLEQTKWDYPLLNPQENVCIPFHNNLSTRILEKDNYNSR